MTESRINSSDDELGEAGSNIDSSASSSRRSGKGSRSKSQSTWEQSLGTNEMIDDPVRLYLREIGRVNLLKASEERVLACAIEAVRHIELITTELTSPEGRPPRAWQVVTQLLRRASDAAPLTEAISRFAGLKGERTIGEVVYDKAMRESLDGNLLEELLNFLA